MRKKIWFILLAFVLCFSLTAAVACSDNSGGGGTETPSGEEEEKPVYEGDMLYNGFDSAEDLYSVTQLYTWNYGPLGKLEIVGAENFIPPADTSETEAAAAAVVAMIEELPEAVTEFSVAAKDAVAKARSAYGDLTDEAKRLVTNIEKLEVLEASDALARYYTLADFGAADIAPSSDQWQTCYGNLVDDTSGTILFTVSGIAENTASAIQLSVFQRGEKSPGNTEDGIAIFLNTNNSTVLFSNTGDGIIHFESGQTISNAKEYTFAISYTVPEERDSVTIDVRITDGDGAVIVDGSHTVMEFQRTTNYGVPDLADWLGGSEAATQQSFVVSTGASVQTSVNSLWTGTDASDYEGPAAEEEDPHDPADLSPRQGEGALRVYYEQGPFTEILARFDRSGLSGLPLEELGGISVKVYNDSAETKRVTLGLMQQQNVAVPVDDAEFILEPYAWTECKVTLNPYIVDALTDELIGLTLRFDDTYDSVYYVDELRVQFGQTYTDEQRETMAKVEALIASVDSNLTGDVTLEDREMLETLYAQYLELPVDWRFMVGNSDDMFSAIGNYLSLRSQESAAGGATSGLLFDEMLGLSQTGDFSGASASYSTDVAYGSDEGSLRLEFDGTATTVTVPVTPIRSDAYEEIHIWVRNDSDLARAFYLGSGWAMADAAYGESVTDGNLDGGYVIPANSGWVELVYYADNQRLPATGVIDEIISVSLINNSAATSVGTLYIGKMVYVVRADYVSGLIAALPEYPAEGTYPEASRAAVTAARAAYDALSASDQSKVTNLDKLVGIEAEIWCEGFAALPAAPAEMTEYSKDYAAAVDALRTSYNALDAVTKAAVAEEEAVLQQFETKLDELLAAMGVENVIELIENLSDYPAEGTYPEASRAAVTIARTAYNNLSAEDRARVTNRSKLFGIEADIWREGFASLPAAAGELNGYSENWPAWSAAIETLRGQYEALDDAVKSLLTEDAARLAGYEAAAEEIQALLDSIAALNEDIAALANETISAESKESLESMYSQYNALSEEYREKVVGYDTLTAAISQYLAAISVQNANGEATVLHFDELLGQTQVAGIRGANAGDVTVAYTPNEHYDADEGSLQVGFTATARIDVDIYVSPVVSGGYDEVHLWVKNTSNRTVAIYLNWNGSDAAYGNGVTGGNIDSGFYLPAGGDWIELVYSANKLSAGNPPQINLAALPVEGEAPAVSGALFIGKMVLVSNAPAVQAQIEALTEYESGYSQENREAVVAARAAYAALSEGSKAAVSNIGKLIGLEAAIWSGDVAGLPAIDTVTEYDEAVAASVSALRTAYDALDDAVQAQENVVAGELLLQQYEEKLAQFGLQHVTALLTALTDKEADAYTAADIVAIQEARAAYNALSPEEQAAVDASLVEKLEACEADTANYYTLSDLTANTEGLYGGDSSHDLSQGGAVPDWNYRVGNLPSGSMNGTIVFTAAGLSENEGALYITLFHDGSSNAGQASDGVAFQLNKDRMYPLTTGPSGTAYMFESGMQLSAAETYTFYIGYDVADDYSSVTVRIRIIASNGSLVANVTHEVTALTPASNGTGNNGIVDLGGSQSIQTWLQTHTNAANHWTLYLNGGNSTGVTVSDAW